jgi:hypothetical protein
MYPGGGSRAYDTSRLLGVALLLSEGKSVQHVTTLNTAGNCNTGLFVYLNISNHTKSTGKYSVKEFFWDVMGF